MTPQLPKGVGGLGSVISSDDDDDGGGGGAAAAVAVGDVVFSNADTLNVTFREVCLLVNSNRHKGRRALNVTVLPRGVRSSVLVRGCYNEPNTSHNPNQPKTTQTNPKPTPKQPKPTPTQPQNNPNNPKQPQTTQNNPKQPQRPRPTTHKRAVVPSSSVTPLHTRGRRQEGGRVRVSVCPWIARNRWAFFRDRIDRSRSFATTGGRGGLRRRGLRRGRVRHGRGARPSRLRGA